jgi:hypothetical protein
VGGGPLQLPRELHRHRVLQAAHRRLQRQLLLVVAQRSRRADQHQPGDTLGVDLSHAPGDKAAPRVTDQGGPPDPDGVQEGHHVVGEVLHRVAAGRPLGVPVAALVQRVGVVAPRQQGQDPTVGEPRVGVGGQKDDRLPARVALLGIVDPRTAGKARGGKPKLRNLLLHGRPSGTPILQRVPILRR